jgi:phosphopantothenoylcysteine synthetase/decarboxylase
MGFALAEAARDRGAEVTLVKGATTAQVPEGVRMVPVESTEDLLAAMLNEYDVDEATAAADLDVLLEKFAEMGVLEK